MDATEVDFHGHHLFALYHLLSTASCKPRILQAASPGLLPPLCTCSTPQSSPQVGFSTVRARDTSHHQPSPAHHQPLCKIAAAPVAGKVGTKASEESYCSGRLPVTSTARSNFQKLTGCVRRMGVCVETGVPEIGVLGPRFRQSNPSNLQECWGDVFSKNRGGLALYPRREVR